MISDSQRFSELFAISPERIHSDIKRGLSGAAELLRHHLGREGTPEMRGLPANRVVLSTHLAMCLASIHFNEGREAESFVTASKAAALIGEEAVELHLLKKRDAGEEFPDDLALYDLWRMVVSAFHRKYGQTLFADMMDEDPALYAKLSAVAVTV